MAGLLKNLVEFLVTYLLIRLFALVNFEATHAIYLA